jgi:hypothetical protein
MIYLPYAMRWRIATRLFRWLVPEPSTPPPQHGQIEYHAAEATRIVVYGQGVAPQSIMLAAGDRFTASTHLHTVPGRLVISLAVRAEALADRERVTHE